MGAAEPANYYVTPEEYLASESLSQQKHEYLDGVVYAMAGASEAHNVISGNIYGELWQRLRGQRCRAFIAAYRVGIRSRVADFYYYPDVLVDCTPFRGESLYAEAPRVVFEVLSKDTDRTDRYEKWHKYQTIASLDVYVLVDQFKPAVTVYRRTEDGWKTELFTLQTDILELPTIGCSLPLATIYERTRLLS